ncbi:SDR family oxidoreductase [Antrihabitans sp. NCIMB 15449]|uniref:SDR family oxidoreductase n=1 Tax=Antrihabitans spumae TaxID=3373370 RepID=A0ABW7JKE7_9NOCA
MSKPTVFITGAAAGIGRATALRFAKEGYLVGLYDVDEPGLRKVRDEITTAGGSAYAGLMNVADPKNWQSALDDFWTAHQRLDILINNAGVLTAGPFEETDPSVHLRMIDINFAGVVYGTRAAFPYLRDTEGAQVVNLCSASAIYGQPELATYGATKAAVKSITEALDLEWRKHNIRVIAMWPLFVQTAMVDGVETGSTKSLGIRLTAEDVGNEIWSVTRNRSWLPGVHYAVGMQAKALAIAAKYSPDFVVRTINRVLTRS